MVIGICFIERKNIFQLLTVDSPRYQEWIKKMRIGGRGKDQCLLFNIFMSILLGIWGDFVHKHIFYILYKTYKNLYQKCISLCVWWFKAVFYKEAYCQLANNENDKYLFTWKNSLKLQHKWSHTCKHQLLYVTVIKKR